MVITSVDRDDLRDGGSGHFVECIQQTRELAHHADRDPAPDFRGRDDRALRNPEGRAARRDERQPGNRAAPVQGSAPGSDYQFSRNLLKKFKALHPERADKSGMMVGLGETDEEILQSDARHARPRHREC